MRDTVMSTTPAGLTRFSRTISTKRNGTCEFCAQPTVAERDFAAVNGGSGKWIAVCATCAMSITEQCKGVIRHLQDVMPSMSAETISNAQTMLPTTEAIFDAVSGTASEAATYDVLSKLQCAALYVQAASAQADPTLGKLQAVANDASRAPRDREFAGSLATQLAARGSLSDKQMFYVNKLIAAPAPAAEANQPTETTDVPAGYYATASRTGNNDLDFWRVDRPETGKWAGYTFVKRIIGGHDPIRLRGAEAKQALATIAATGIEAAGKAYASAIGNCYACNRELTDEESRRVGLGPVCRNR
jgi:hypothetical protein